MASQYNKEAPVLKGGKGSGPAALEQQETDKDQKKQIETLDWLQSVMIPAQVPVGASNGEVLDKAVLCCCLGFSVPIPPLEAGFPSRRCRFWTILLAVQDDPEVAALWWPQ